MHGTVKFKIRGVPKGIPLFCNIGLEPLERRYARIGYGVKKCTFAHIRQTNETKFHKYYPLN